MFVSRLTENAASLRAVGTVALGTAIIAAGVVTTATPASASDGAATVTLTVDGVRTSVTTTADTVSELLTQEAVPYDSSDLVDPGLKATLFDGMGVSWTPATRVFVRDNGERTSHKVVGETVSQIRSELSLPTGEDLTFARLEDYSYEDAHVYGPLGRKLAASDVVRDDSVAVVHKIRLAFTDGFQRIDRKVVTDRSPLVRQGGKRVFKDGRDGRARVVYRKRFIDGELAGQRVVRSRIVRESQRRVVRVGTGPNWAGLAACESGGNPNAVNPAGFYGLYQFSHLHLAFRRRQGHPHRLRLLGADQAGLEALQGSRPLAVATLRQPALATLTTLATRGRR